MLAIKYSQNFGSIRSSELQCRLAYPEVVKKSTHPHIHRTLGPITSFHYMTLTALHRISVAFVSHRKKAAEKSAFFPVRRHNHGDDDSRFKVAVTPSPVGGIHFD